MQLELNWSSETNQSWNRVYHRRSSRGLRQIRDETEFTVWVETEFWDNSELKQNILIFHQKNFFLKKFWLENFLFLCNFVTKRHRHELSEGWKKFYWCQNHILTLALYSSECGEHVSMSGCEVWTNIDGDRGTNVKNFQNTLPSVTFWNNRVHLVSSYRYRLKIVLLKE